jgi:hypothetical protein
MYLGTTLLSAINLAAPTTHQQVLLATPPFTYHAGALTLRVASSGRLVQIDGIAISPV